jgi:hypothetical protein
VFSICRSTSLLGSPHRMHDLTKASWSILEASHVSSSHVNFNQVSRHVQNDIKMSFILLQIRRALKSCSRAINAHNARTF